MQIPTRLDEGGVSRPEDRIYVPVPGRAPVAVTQPIEVRNCESVIFTGISDDLVLVNITIRDGSVLTQVRRATAILILIPTIGCC